VRIELKWAATAVLGVLVLCGFALINGGPIVYPDTSNYLGDGEQLVRLTTPNNTRPVFYGLAIWFLHWERTVWPVLLAQGAVVVHVIYLCLRTMEVRLRPLPFLALLACLAALTPLSWHVSHVLPDIFTGVATAALFLLGFTQGRLSRWEIGYLVVLATACICFHLTNLVMGAALAGMGWLAWLLLRRRGVPVRPLLLTLPTALALLAHVAFSMALYHRVAFAPKSPPHLMARLIADGPGRDYLRAACPTTPYYLCRDLDRLPATENGILYRYMSVLSTEDGYRIKAEADDVVHGTIRMFPLQVAGHMLLNTARQFVTIGALTELDMPWWHMMQHDHPYLARDASNTLQMRGAFDGDGLDGLNVVYDAVALASGAAFLGLAWACFRRRQWRPLTFMGVVFVALWANAFACGALGGVFGRYQGRMIWLVPLAAFAAASVLAGVRARAAEARAPAGSLDLPA